MRFLTALILAACGKDEEADPPAPGTISLSWTIGSQGCSDAGIEEIAVIADGTDELATFDCAIGSGTIEGLDPGGYDLSVLGRDVAGADRYGVEVADVVVEAGVDTPLGNVTLSALPAEIVAMWVFDNGGLCAQNDAETVHVRLFDSGDFLEFDGEAPCDDGILPIGGINGGTWTVDVEALSAAGIITWTGEQDVVVGTGESVDATVTLSLAP